jgi:hypothetical protein
MMMRSSLPAPVAVVMLFLICCLFQQEGAQAFAPRPASFSPATKITAARPAHAAALVLRMAEGGDQEKPNVVSADGTFYDDEVSVLVAVVALCIPFHSAQSLLLAAAGGYRPYYRTVHHSECRYENQSSNQSTD